MTAQFQLPATPLGPRERAEDQIVCEFCGEAGTEFGCRCDAVDAKIYDALERGDQS